MDNYFGDEYKSLSHSFLGVIYSYKIHINDSVFSPACIRHIGPTSLDQYRISFDVGNREIWPQPPPKVCPNVIP